jgi:hypothetical protein
VRQLGQCLARHPRQGKFKPNQSADKLGRGELDTIQPSESGNRDLFARKEITRDLLHFLSSNLLDAVYHFIHAEEPPKEQFLPGEI